MKNCEFIYMKYGYYDDDTLFDVYKCSNCDKEFTITEDFSGEGDYKYCPFCGYKIVNVNYNG